MKPLDERTLPFLHINKCLFDIYYQKMVYRNYYFSSLLHYPTVNYNQLLFKLILKCQSINRLKDLKI